MAFARKMVAGLLLVGQLACGSLVPWEDEFQVNSRWAGAQVWPTVAGLKDGGFVTGWVDAGGSYIGTFGQRFDAAGIAAAGQFRIDPLDASSGQNPSVTCIGDAGFVYTWMGQTSTIYGQVYDLEGHKRGAPFSVNGQVFEAESNPWITSLNDGMFVIVWTRKKDDGTSNVYGKVFTTDAGAVVDEFMVNTYTKGEQHSPRVAGLKGKEGRFVVTWTSKEQDGDEDGVYGSMVELMGASVVMQQEFRVNTRTKKAQRASSVAGLPNGGFAVAWESDGQDAHELGVFMRVYGADGKEATKEQMVNQHEIKTQGRPSVAALTSGGFFVAWESEGQDSSSFGVFGREFQADGAPAGDEFQVNTHFQNVQLFPAAAGLKNGGAVVLWASYNQDGDNFGVFGQKLQECSGAVTDNHGTVFPSVRLEGSSSVQHSSGLHLHDIPEAVVNGKDATAWFPPLPMPEGTALEVSCCGKEACDVFVSIFHCPPCSGDKNGGYPALLPTEGFVARSCAPKFTERDDYVKGWENERHRMVTFHRRLVPGEVFTLPKTIKPTSHIVVFKTSAPVADDWCPNISKGCGGPCPPGKPCAGRFCCA